MDLMRKTAAEAAEQNYNENQDCLQLQSDIVELTQAIKASKKKIDELTNIINMKETLINEIDLKYVNSEMLTEVLDATDQLTKEKQRCRNLESQLKDKSDKLAHLSHDGEVSIQNSPSEDDITVHIQRRIQWHKKMSSTMDRVMAAMVASSNQVANKEEELNQEREKSQNLTSMNHFLKEKLYEALMIRPVKEQRLLQKIYELEEQCQRDKEQLQREREENYKLTKELEERRLENVSQKIEKASCMEEKREKEFKELDVKLIGYEKEYVDQLIKNKITKKQLDDKEKLQLQNEQKFNEIEKECKKYKTQIQFEINKKEILKQQVNKLQLELTLNKDQHKSDKCTIKDANKNEVTKLQKDLFCLAKEKMRMEERVQLSEVELKKLEESLAGLSHETSHRLEAVRTEHEALRSSYKYLAEKARELEMSNQQLCDEINQLHHQSQQKIKYIQKLEQSTLELKTKLSILKHENSMKHEKCSKQEHKFKFPQSIINRMDVYKMTLNTANVRSFFYVP